jgi:transposase
MARPLADDLRERVVQAVERGKTQAEVAAFFGLGLRTVERYISRWRENGQIARGKFGGHKKHLLADHAERVDKLVTAEPDLTLAALCQRLAAAGIKVSTSALDRFVRAAGFTYKKNAGRCRTKAPRRADSADRLASGAKRLGSFPAGVHRRNLGDDQYDAALRTRG